MINERRPLPENGRYFEYLRKSRDEMRQEKLYGGDVLAKHAMMLDYTAEVNRHFVAKVFREVVSGETIADRPEMRRVIDEVQSGMWDGAYVMAVDRLSRGSQQDQGVILDLLKITGLFIVTPSGYFDPWNANDFDTIRYQLFNSNNEFLSYSRRMHDSIRTSVMCGQYMGRYVPFGLDKVVLPNGFKTLRKNDDFKYVEMMFRWAGYDDMSLYEIAKRLTSMGVRTPRGPEGREWCPTTVGAILSNEAYIGQSKWGKHQTQHTFTTDVLERRKVRRVTDSYSKGEGEWGELIHRELFDLVAARRSKRLPIRGDGQVSNVLAGLLVCSECGRAMAVLNERRNGKKRFAHKTGFKCTQKGAYEDLVLAKLAEQLKEVVDDYEFRLDGERACQERARNEEAVANLEKAVAKLDERAKFLLVMRTNQEITAEEFAAARAEIASDREDACDRLEAARDALDKVVDYDAMASTIHRAIDMLGDDGVSRAAKNRFLRTFIKQIRYSNASERGENDLLRLEIVFL